MGTDTVAFALRQDFVGTVTQYATQEDKDAGNGIEVDKYLGGVITIGPSDGTPGSGELNIKEALDEGDGVITIPAGDARAVDALDHYAPLKRVGVEEDVEILSSYDDHNADALREELGRRNVVGTSANKPELVKALEEYDRLESVDELEVEDLSVTTLNESADAFAAGGND